MTIGRIIGWVVGIYLAIIVVSLTVKTVEGLTGHSINELGRIAGWILIIGLFTGATIYKVIAFTGLFGGMWTTRHVRHTNRYGTEKGRNVER